MNKKIIMCLLAGLITVSSFTACEKQNAEIKNASANTYAPIGMPQKANLGKAASASASDNKKDIRKLRALMFDGYNEMKISDFQNKVWKMTDTYEYRDYLERLSSDEAFYQTKDSDDDAYFMFYILEPLTAEKWQSKTYSGIAVSDLRYPSDNASLEYDYKLNILDVNAVCVKDYNDLRLGVTGVMQEVLKNKTKEELQNASTMQEYIQTYIDDALKYMQAPEISIEINFAYFPIPSADEIQQSTGVGNATDEETRIYAHGTKEDYFGLLALKTQGYENILLADFNGNLLEWVNNNRESMERIDDDLRLNDYRFSMSDEELAFLKFTVYLSGMENGKEIQNLYTGTQGNCPYYDENLPQKNIYENGTARCDLYYRFSYNISDTEKITVGERDSQIKKMINAIHVFWNNTDIDDILKMSKSDIEKKLEKFAETYSTDNITIVINSEKLHFEKADERGIIF